MDEINQLHLLRPWWLLCIPLWLALSIWLQKRQRNNTGFEQWIDHTLLNHLRTGDNAPAMWLPYIAFALMGILASVALAGPTWKQLPQPLHESQHALVIVLDLSPSMNAQDNKPSRIVRARLKIQDLLKQRQDGLTALVVYAGEAHIVTPLTDDTRTISNLLATLEPGLLPIPGSNIEMAIEQAQALVTDAGLNTANIVVITDGIAAAARPTLNQLITPQWPLFILGLGTEAGAPIPTKDGFLKDDQQRLITAKRDSALLEKIAQENQGYYLPLQADDSDIHFINQNSNRPQSGAAKEVERNVDQWHEFGPTLLLLLLPLLAMAFRRGWLLSLFYLSTPYLLLPNTAEASIWDNLWLNQDQQGQKQFIDEKFDAAAKAFNNHRWKGSAAYKNKDYETAITEFSKGHHAVDDYNRGNALAQLQRFDEAIAAYDQALNKQPDFTDAQKNKQTLEKLKQQQQQQEQNQEQDNNQQQDQQQNQDQNQQGNKSEEASDSTSPADEPQNNQQQQADSEGEQQDSQQAADDKQSTEDKNKEEAQAAEQANDDSSEDSTSAEHQRAQQEMSHLTEEEQQALNQWIRKIPDDPSGLLRRKFEYEFQKRRQEYQRGDWKLPDNDAHKRY